MREIDQALARAYGSPASPSRKGEPPASPSPARPPGPHFAIDDPQPGPSREATALTWPATVRALERQHGARFSAMAEALIEARDARQAKVLLFTSCHRAEGKTSLVLTLARALARKPGRTLLVDADLSGPMLARQLGLRPRVGLEDVVEGGVSPAEAVIDAADDHLFVLPLKAPIARPREFLDSPGWACLVAGLRREFDLVLLDGGPLFVGLGATEPPRGLDAAVLVHHAGLTGERSLLRAREALDRAGVPLLGLAETFC